MINLIIQIASKCRYLFTFTAADETENKLKAKEAQHISL